MSMGRRFRYPIDSVLSLREWELVALKIERHRLNSELTREKEDLAELQKEMRALSEYSSRSSGQTQYFSAERFSMVVGYFRELSKKLEDKKASVLDLERNHELFIEKIYACQRSLDAIKNHRKKIKEASIREQLSTEYKSLDDQWLFRQGRVHPYVK